MEEQIQQSTAQHRLSLIRQFCYDSCSINVPIPNPQIPGVVPRDEDAASE